MEQIFVSPQLELAHQAEHFLVILLSAVSLLLYNLYGFGTPLILGSDYVHINANPVIWVNQYWEKVFKVLSRQTVALSLNKEQEVGYQLFGFNHIFYKVVQVLTNGTDFDLYFSPNKRLNTIFQLNFYILELLFKCLLEDVCLLV